MKTVLSVLFGASTLLASCPILAADRTDMAFEESKKFDGFFVGALVGIGEISAPILFNDFDDIGGEYELMAGYRHQNESCLDIGLE